MVDFNIQVDDLVLYFMQTQPARPAYRVLSRSVYENPGFEFSNWASIPGADGAVMSEVGVAADAIYYVTNLTRLRDPLTPADHTKAPDKVDVSKFSKPAPAPGDLVIVSNVDDPTKPKGYLIPRNYYEGQLPELPPDEISDIDFMVQEEGVLLANIRKFENTGISCYLLNLTGLRSGQ